MLKNFLCLVLQMFLYFAVFEYSLANPSLCYMETNLQKLREKDKEWLVNMDAGYLAVFFELVKHLPQIKSDVDLLISCLVLIP